MDLCSPELAREHALYGELSRVNNELANLQRELVAANRELARLHEQKNEMLGMAAHDLRGPLGAVRSLCDFVDDGPLDDGQRQCLDRIRQSVEAMLALVNDFLDVAAIEAGRLRLDPRPVDLVSVVHENAVMQRLLAAPKGVRIEVHAPAEAVVVRADRARLDQVLGNLVGNAVKHSPRGAIVRVRIEPDEEGACISVIDRGAGIAPEDLKRLFQSFTPGRAGPRPGESSHGLGLAIVQKIVQAHGGVVEVQSAPGEGSCFRVRLQREGPTPPSGRPPPRG